MRLKARRLFAFGVQFLVFFTGFLLIYPALLPVYNGVALGLANAVLSSLPSPMSIQPAPDHSWQVYRLPSKRLVFTVEGDYLSLIYLNLALLPALILVTPVLLLQRLKLLGWGMALLLGVHALSAIALTRAEICVHYNPNNVGCNVVEGIFGTGGQLFAVAIWALLTWRYWLPMKTALPKGGAP